MPEDNMFMGPSRPVQERSDAIQEIDSQSANARRNTKPDQEVQKKGSIPPNKDIFDDQGLNTIDHRRR